MSDPWILHDPNVPDLPFEHLDRCLKHASNAIDAYLDDIGNEWSDEVTEVHISRSGIVTHRATEVILPWPDWIAEQIAEDPDYKPPFDYNATFHMAEVEPVLE